MLNLKFIKKLILSLAIDKEDKPGCKLVKTCLINLSFFSIATLQLGFFYGS